MLLATLALKACSLLTSADIAAVQQQTPTEARETASRRGELDVGQCFYVLPTFTKSVSVEVARGNVAGLMEKARVQRGQEQDEGEEHAVEPVKGLGDEAFWAGGARLGGLYVRRGDALLRFAIGGPENKAVKLKKLRRLARKALARLPR